MIDSPPISLTGKSGEVLERLYSEEVDGAKIVHEYLRNNPNVFEEFVSNFVDVDDIERLLIRKTHRQRFWGEHLAKSKF